MNIFQGIYYIWICSGYLINTQVCVLCSLCLPLDIHEVHELISWLREPTYSYVYVVLLYEHLRTGKHIAVLINTGIDYWNAIHLPHRGRVTHISVSNLTIIGSDNGLDRNGILLHWVDLSRWTIYSVYYLEAVLFQGLFVHIGKRFSIGYKISLDTFYYDAWYQFYRQKRLFLQADQKLKQNNYWYSLMRIEESIKLWFCLANKSVRQADKSNKNTKTLFGTQIFTGIPFFADCFWYIPTRR